MQCPHCHHHYSASEHHIFLGSDSDGYWWTKQSKCANVSCGRLIFHLILSHDTRSDGPRYYEPSQIDSIDLIRPKVPNRQPIPPEVPQSFRQDYIEACLVIPHSPAASAALSRRCLQYILREKVGIRDDNLYKEIETAINSQNLPSHIADSMDTLRKMGNMSAHPMHNKNTGEIVSVDHGEAEWCLDVIEILFDFYFVQPAKTQQRRKEFDQKYSSAR